MRSGAPLDTRVPKIKWIHPLPSCTGDIIWRRRPCPGDWKADPGCIESRPYGPPLDEEQRSEFRWEVDSKTDLERKGSESLLIVGSAGGF